MNRYLDLAAALSRQSDMSKQVGAVIVRGGRVLGVGFNRMGSCKHTPAAWSRHAETQAVLSAGSNVKGATVYVYRGKHTPRLARPCDSCRTLLTTVGVRTMVYSVEDGWERERV